MFFFLNSGGFGSVANSTGKVTFLSIMVPYMDKILVQTKIRCMAILCQFARANLYFTNLPCLTNTIFKRLHTSNSRKLIQVNIASS